MKSAWLVTWEWANDAAAIADEVAAIFPRQWGDRRVKGCVEMLYSLATSTPAELVGYAAKPSHNPYRPDSQSGRITCGHNPFLEARIVTDLIVDADQDGFDVIRWTEPDSYELNGDVGRLRKIADGERKCVRRRIRGPLSSEEIWDRAKGDFKPGWAPGETPPQPQ